MAAAVEEASAARMEVEVVVGEAMVATSAGLWMVGFDGMKAAVEGEAGTFVGCCVREGCFSRSGEPPLLSAGRR